MGRPVARLAGPPRQVLEVVRLVTDGTPNACSMLYAAAELARAGAKSALQIIWQTIVKDHALENHAGARPTKRRPPRVCTWCGGDFTGGRSDYCSDEHRRLARTIQAGSIPQRPCPRCGCNDLRIASAEFAICQTCGFQPDRPELLIVELAPPACSGVTRVKREILNERGCEVFFADRPGGKRP